ncbi:unnamed protein product, partial [Ectocarpus sp. 6 AP-2014]
KPTGNGADAFPLPPMPPLLPPLTKTAASPVTCSLFGPASEESQAPRYVLQAGLEDVTAALGAIDAPATLVDGGGPPSSSPPGRVTRSSVKRRRRREDGRGAAGLPPGAASSGQSKGVHRYPRYPPCQAVALIANCSRRIRPWKQCEPLGGKASAARYTRTQAWGAR